MLCVQIADFKIELFKQVSFASSIRQLIATP